MFIKTRRAVMQRLLPPAFDMPAKLETLADKGNESDSLSADQQAAIWKAMKRLYRRGLNPGVGLAIRYQGKLAFNRTLGYGNLAQQRVMKVDDPTCLFSASKAITAMLVHHLIETGELSVTDRVTKFIPEYAQHGKSKTTILDLLAHRAGIARLPDANPDILYDTHAAVERLIAARPNTPVGKRQAYHAITGGFILGEIIERVTQQPLNALLDEVIRQPLGMTYFHYGIAPELQNRVPLHYVAGPKPALLDTYLTHAVGGDLDMIVDVSNDSRFMQAVIPAGNLYATAEETTRFYQMLLDGGVWQGKRVFSEATIRRAIHSVSAPVVIDGSLLAPVRFSEGFMLGGQVFSPFGPRTKGCFGHLGFVTIVTYADPARDMSVALVTTGKGVIGTQITDVFNLLGVIKKQVA